MKDCTELISFVRIEIQHAKEKTPCKLFYADGFTMEEIGVCISLKWNFGNLN